MTDQVDNSIFEEGASTKPNPVATPNDQEGVKIPQPDMNAVFQDHLASIKNESGEQKYSDVITALSALKHSQDHIQTLQEENSDMRSKLQEAKTIDDILTLQTANNNSTDQTDNAKIGVDDVKEAALNVVKEYEASKVAMSNQKQVADALVEKFGSREKAEEVYNSKARELGLDLDVFNTLSAKSPKAVLDYFSDAEDKSSLKNIQGTVNAEALASNSDDTQRTRKNIMYGASNKDLIEAWRVAGETVKKELEIN